MIAGAVGWPWCPGDLGPDVGWSNLFNKFFKKLIFLNFFDDVEKLILCKFCTPHVIL